MLRRTGNNHGKNYCRANETRDVTHDEFNHYWLTHDAPMVREMLPGLRKYVINTRVDSNNPDRSDKQQRGHRMNSTAIIKPIPVFKNILTPVRIGTMEVKNRIVMAPTSNHMTKGGAFTERERTFYATRARGGVGLIMIGATYVHPLGGDDEDLGLSDDKFIPHYKDFIEGAHQYGTRISIQLYHAGRYAARHMQGDNAGKAVAPSPLPWPPGSPIPHELSEPEIQELVRTWGEAAGRAKRAGFDMIEIHAAHGYLPAQFLSPHANMRQDSYGGDFKGRSRFLREVVESCRRNVGGGVPICVRLSGAEFVEGGLTVVDQQETARCLEQIGTDCISITSGLAPYWGHTRCVPGMFYPVGLNVDLAAAIKSVVKIPVIVAGRLHDPYLAEKVLAEGKADLIAMARQLICDPQYTNKLTEGRVEEIRGCISCNNCHNRSLDDRGTRCILNVEAGREMKLKIAPANARKRVWVAGGGPSGMEAARVLMLRGHDVTLFEKDGQLGGRLRLASIPPHKGEYLNAVKYFEKELARLGVKIRIGIELTRDQVEKGRPDALVVAFGAALACPPIPGAETANVVMAEEVLRGTAVTAEPILVIGGGPVGAETAHYLAAQGKRVTIVEILPEMVPDMLVDFRYHLLAGLTEYGVDMLCNTEVREIQGRRVLLKATSGETRLEGIEAVVIACGSKANMKAAEQFEGLGMEIRVVGDAVKPADGVKAIYDGYMAGYDL